jgi:hypothetical protein
MNTYRYSRDDPRLNQRHYSYAPFEGIEFLRAWSHNRARIKAQLNKRLVDCLPGTDPVKQQFALLPRLGIGSIDTELVLRACANALFEFSSNDLLIEEWAGFFLRKIEIAHRLRNAYGPDGKMSDKREAESAAYAFAAYVLASMAVRRRLHPERLKWLNALLKTLDILSFRIDDICFDAFAATCAVRALEIELDQVSFEASRLGVSWQQ